MKRNLLILSFLMVVSMPKAMAITTEDVLSEPYIENHGYSQEMVRLMDLQSTQINGKAPGYKVKEPAYYTTDKRVKFIRSVAQYFDCGYDRGNFGSDQIHFTTRYDDI